MYSMSTTVDTTVSVQKNDALCACLIVLIDFTGLIYETYWQTKCRHTISVLSAGPFL